MTSVGLTYKAMWEGCWSLFCFQNLLFFFFDFSFSLSHLLCTHANQRGVLRTISVTSRPRITGNRGTGMFGRQSLLLMRHIGQDVPRRHTHFVLESRLMYEKSFRDEWMRSLCQAVSNLDEPLAKSLSGTRQQMLQRKVACFSYNQFGLFKVPYYRLANVDRYHAVQGTPGTREWVPYANVSYWTMNKMVRSGNILVHRVHYTGWGTDKSLNQGGWEHRWNKVMQRNALQYTRI